MGVLGVRVYALKPLSRRVILIFLSLGEGFSLNFDILVRGSPRFIDNSRFLTAAALRRTAIEASAPPAKPRFVKKGRTPY